MKKVNVLMNNGVKKTMELRFARALEFCGKGFIVKEKAISKYEKKVIETGVFENKDLSELRAKYQDKFGKKAYHGWTVDELTSKIESAE